MEIRLAERQNGRMKNIEIYSEEDFKAMLNLQINLALKNVGTLAKFLPGYKSKVVKELKNNLFNVFKNRLKANLNK